MQNPPPPPQMPSGYQPGYPAAAGYVSQPAYAGFWVRFVAYIVDIIILAIVEGIIGVILGVNIKDPFSESFRTANGLGVVFSLAYFAGLWAYMGGTLGQRLLGLRVADAHTGLQITVGKAALRWLGLLLALAVCLIGVIWVAFDSRKQGWADKIAGTLVLRG